MEHNYKKRGLPDGMMGESHTHSDGETMPEVNAYHAKMTAGVGSSSEQYSDTSRTDEAEVGMKDDHNGPEKEAQDGSPRVSEGARG